MAEKVLFVDDDPNVLSTYERVLRKRYNIETAIGGEEGLERIAKEGPFAVVVSDIGMPKMDGIQFLSRVQELAPDTVRMVLTGHTDLETAIEAVNAGYVFRFLTKPCKSAEMTKAVEAGIEQYRLIMARTELTGLRKLKEAMKGIILGFSTLVEQRDPYTAGHQKRVTELSLAIAESMGIEGDQVAGLQMAAMVHDIGKVYVPSDFLNRPGKLNDVEFAVIKEHPKGGSTILKSVDFEWPISQIVLQHHERMDGSGYPNGLSGDNILLEARIVAVADVIDAMASHRPYRPSLGIDKALEEVEANKGMLYDPDAVAACLTLFRGKGFVFDG